MSVQGVTQEVIRRLWLLGPAYVDQGPRPQTSVKASEMAALDTVEVPRFRSRRTVALLGYLAAERRPIGREHLALLFWPDTAPTGGRANLSRELHNLAQILPGCWDLNRRSVAFVPSAGTSVDLYESIELEDQERWAEAAELLGGEFLEGINLDNNPEFENWLLVERERWRRRSEKILRRVIERYTKHGNYTDALRQAQRLLQLAPWDEDTHRHSMRLLAWIGQRGAALRQFASCKEAMREQLDLQPDQETVTLYQQIRDGHIDLPPQLPAFLTEERARPELDRPPFVGRENELEQLEVFIDSTLAGKGQVIFITGGPGRGKTALLEAFAQDAMDKHPKLLVAGGNCNAYSGVGDPYLPYRDVMAMFTGDVEGRWEAGAISRDHACRLWDVFPLVVQTVLDHGPDLLDVLVPSAAVISLAIATKQDNTPWFLSLREHNKRQITSPKEVNQGQLFQQFTNVLLSLAKERPMLLILDDIQWADTATISLLFHIGRRLAETEGRILIACAYRPEEVAVSLTGERHPLAKVLSELKRTYGNVFVDLSLAEAKEERRFIDALLDSEPNKLTGTFREALFERTGGHPLFTVELLRAMQERGDLSKDKEGEWIEGPALNWELLPAKVEAVIEDRIGRLDPELCDLLTIASVEGEVFTANVVADVRGVPERPILRRLSQDLERRHRLVREQEEIEASQVKISRFRFGHVLFQEYLYRRLSQGERRLLHGDVAIALEKLYAGQLDQMAVQLAHHFYEAGYQNHAFQFFTLAAERADRFFASREAIAHYSNAIDLADKVSPDIDTLIYLHQRRGLAYGIVGDFERARADHECVLENARADGKQYPAWQALLDLGRLWASRDYSRARDYFEDALELARSIGEQAALADSLNWMGNWCANNEYPEKAVAYHQEALSIFEDIGSQRALANTLDLLGLANLLGGNLVTSSQHYDRAIALSRELDDRPRLASSLTGRATTYSALVWLASVSTSEVSDAISDIQESLQIARKIGSASEEIWTYWSLGLLYIVQGQYGLALRELQSGLDLASEIGHREWVVGNQFALGILHTELFDLDRAQEQLEDALSLTGELRSPTWTHLVRGALARVYMMLDNQESAQICLNAAISPQTPMDTLGKRYCWLWQAELSLSQDEPSLALDATDRLIASAPGMEAGRVITYLSKLKAEALVVNRRAEGEYEEEAWSLLEAAVENAEATGERFLLWRLHATLGHVYRRSGRKDLSGREFSAAQALIDKLAATVSDDVLKEGFLEGAYRSLGAHF